MEYEVRFFSGIAHSRKTLLLNPYASGKICSRWAHDMF
jgi:hypothetical protein